MFVLILVFQVYYRDAYAMQEFETREKCEASAVAAKQIGRWNPEYSVRFVCVSK
jgi:hypothetical protein